MRPKELLIHRWICLVIFLLFIIGCNRPKQPGISKRVKTSELETAGLSAPDTKELDALLMELKQNNPFNPEHSTGLTGADNDFHLQGIVWDAQRPLAIIGNRVFVENDFINGRKVIKINKDFIELDNGGAKEVLKLD